MNECQSVAIAKYNSCNTTAAHLDIRKTVPLFSLGDQLCHLFLQARNLALHFYLHSQHLPHSRHYIGDCCCNQIISKLMMMFCVVGSALFFKFIRVKQPTEFIRVKATFELALTMQYIYCVNNKTPKFN